MDNYIYILIHCLLSIHRIRLLLRNGSVTKQNSMSRRCSVLSNIACSEWFQRQLKVINWRVKLSHAIAYKHGLVVSHATKSKKFTPNGLNERIGEPTLALVPVMASIGPMGNLGPTALFRVSIWRIPQSRTWPTPVTISRPLPLISGHPMWATVALRAPHD